jgi:hypothetical protein
MTYNDDYEMLDAGEIHLHFRLTAVKKTKKVPVRFPLFP